MSEEMLQQERDTPGELLKHKFPSRLWILIAYLASCAPALWAEATADKDELSPAEENYVYSTKSPSQRVKAFLKVAEFKVEQVKKDVRGRTSSDFRLGFRGYSTAIEGAWMGVSWGQARRVDMTESVRAIRRTTKRHTEVLQKLEATATDAQRQALDQVLATILRMQNSESNNSYAQR
jgi:hypothetical protein